MVRGELLPKLPADQRAIILGLTPRGALSYDASPIPAALVVDPATGTTAVMVAQRDATRFTIQAENAQKAKMLDAYNAELSNNLFTSIELVCKATRRSIRRLSRRYITTAGRPGRRSSRWASLLQLHGPQGVRTSA